MKTYMICTEGTSETLDAGTTEAEARKILDERIRGAALPGDEYTLLADERVIDNGAAPDDAE